MAKFVREFVEYCGISAEVPENVKAFKNVTSDEVFRISEKKPSIKNFLKCTVEGSIYNFRLVNGVVGNGADGKKLTGMKCAVEGEVNCRVEYLSKVGTDLIYTDKVTLPIVTSVPLTEDYAYSNNVVSSLFIDDIYLERINDREYIVSISGIVTIED